MLRFKQFLLEAPAPPDIKDLQDYVREKESLGNEDTVLRLHGGPNDPTIGFGHSLQDPKSSREKFARVLPEVDFDAISSGKGSLTRDQAQTLFDDDTKDNIAKLRAIIPELDEYTPEGHRGLYSSTYRGVLGGSPKAVKLLRAGQFEAAADELLNNNEYRLSKAGQPIKGRILPGIAARMEEESNLIRGEGERRKAAAAAAAAAAKEKQQASTPQQPPPSTPVSAAPATSKPVAAPVPKAPTQKEYTIQSGDTLWAITKGDQKKIDKIVAANPGMSPDRIKPGQKIKIPD